MQTEKSLDLTSTIKTAKNSVFLRFASVLTIFLCLLALSSSPHTINISGLSANADYQQLTDFTWSYRAQSSSFSVVDNYTVSLRFSIGPTSEGSVWGTQRFKELVFSGSTTNTLQQQELLYSVQVLEYNTENVRYESDWISVNTRIPIYALDQTQGGQRLNSYRVYVRRKDGGVLTPSSMRPSVVTVYGGVYQLIPQETLPAEWLETTTYVPRTVATTTVVNPYYDDIVGTTPDLQPEIGGDAPEWFEQYDPNEQAWFIDVLDSGTDFITYYIRIALDLKFIWVFAGFVIVGCLLAWLLH